MVKKMPERFDKNAVRNWSLYVIKLTDGHYYVGITSFKDYMRRINQHGGRLGAKVNRGKTVEEIVEVQHLGAMSGRAAEQIENDVTLAYRKKYGARKVRGGYDTFKKTSLIPTYTPGSIQSIIFIIGCLLVAIALVLFIADFK